MTTKRFGAGWLLALTLGTLLVGGCALNASPQPSAAVASAPASVASVAPVATPTATPEASEAPSEEPSEEPGAEPSASGTAVDPTEDLTIGGPYELQPLDETSSAAFQAGISEGLGAMGEVIDFGAMTVQRDGQDVAVLLAMAFPDFPGMDDPSFFESVMGGVAGSSGGEVEETTIGGKTVGLVEGPGTAFAGYQQDATVIFAIGQSMDEVTEVITELIEANG